jgi:hypothetical protein
LRVVVKKLISAKGICLWAGVSDYNASDKRLTWDRRYLDFFGLERSSDKGVDLQADFYVQPRMGLVYRFKNGWYTGFSGSYEQYLSSDLDNGWSAAVLVGYSDVTE